MKETIFRDTESSEWWKESIHTEDLNIPNLYVLKKRASKIYKEKLKKKKKTARRNRQNPIIIKDFNTPLSVIRRTSRQKIGKYIEDLNYIISLT